MKPGLFCDRDGTLMVDMHYASRPEDVVVIDRMVGLVIEANIRDIPVIVVSNQSGIARGLMTERGVMAVNDELKKEYLSRGAVIDAFYWCPHLPEDCCRCRKPSPGMLLRAAFEVSVELFKSVLVGDKTSDLETAQEARLMGWYNVSDPDLGTKLREWMSRVS